MSGRATDPSASARAAEKRARRAEAKVSRERELRRKVRRRRIRVGVATVATLAVAVVVAFGLVSSGKAGVSFAGDLRTGGRLEALSLPRLEGGGTIDYGDLSGRPLVINFFASWCPNCIAEMPDFERVHQRLGDEVAFLGISQSDPRRASIDLAHETGITYDSGIDQNGAFFRAIGGLGMPTTVFIQPGGEIAEVWVGQLDVGSLESLIETNFGVAA